MAKFSGTQTIQRPKDQVKTTTTRRHTAEGAMGWERDAKSELFLLAISNMVSEDTFYESARERDNRFRTLIHQVVREDPEWVARFIPYLRNTMQMRSASTVMAVEYGLSLNGVDRSTLAQDQYPRHVLSSALSRADEPGEAIGYYFATQGKNLPMWLKRGLSDAAARLFNERSALKYDGLSRGIRLGDVIELTHARPKDKVQSKLFRYLIDRRHHRDDASTDGLETISRALALNKMPVAERRAWLESDEFDPELLELAGFTWERLSGWLQGPMDKTAWESIIPSMGYMAILRNLRNFEEAKISNRMVDLVINTLQDPEEVRRSRQFPIRFYSAFKATDSLKWASALERGLELSLSNVPYLKGTTLILIDTSGSMDSAISAKSDIMRYEVASLFGLTLAHRTERSHTYTYAYGPHPLHVGNSLHLDMRNVRARVGGGTDTFGSLEATYKGQDRVIILTDEQAHSPYFGYGTPDRIVDKIDAPIYTFNVAGYKTAQMDNGGSGRYAFGGLTDAGFKMINLIEQYRTGVWPWMNKKDDYV